MKAMDYRGRSSTSQRPTEKRTIWYYTTPSRREQIATWTIGALQSISTKTV